MPECDSIDLSDCPNFLVLELGSGGTAQPARNWLVQAEADVHVELALSTDRNLCGLVNTEQTGPKAVLDHVRVHALSDPTDPTTPDQGIPLSAVVKKRAGNPTIALRCTRLGHFVGPGLQIFDDVAPTSAKIVALEVGSVTGP